MIWKLLGVSADEDFNISAQGWFKITICAAAVSFVFFVCSGLTVLAQSTTSEMQKVSQAFAPFLVGLVATVTFCAAIWRGKLNSEQIKQQKRQNDAKDEENLAKLMMDGAKMLGEEKDSHVLAGIAALQAVVATPDTKFATHSMDLLADFASENISTIEKSRSVNSARIALNTGAASGYCSSRRIEVTAAHEEEFHEVYNGFARVKYMGGWIVEETYQSLQTFRTVEFESVKFEGCTFTVPLRGFRRCEFQECKFSEVGLTLIRANSFENCDFTRTKFTKLSRSRDLNQAQKKEIAKLKTLGCFYNASNPPTGLGITNWAQFLNIKEDE
ncbi:hypothetical protein [Agrobacterium cavarae]|uniref:hypothetical protein n=1 Tax=Agrobacterium cavarae TaxID=2528239 RepID=UPI002FD9FC1E